MGSFARRKLEVERCLTLLQWSAPSFHFSPHQLLVRPIRRPPTGETNLNNHLDPSSEHAWVLSYPACQTHPIDGTHGMLRTIGWVLCCHESKVCKATIFGALKPRHPSLGAGNSVPQPSALAQPKTQQEMLECCRSGPSTYKQWLSFTFQFAGRHPMAWKKDHL